MLKEIGTEDRVDSYIEDKLARKEKIMGMGHRVYRVLDPRAPHLRRMAIRLSSRIGEPKWIRMSERIAKASKGCFQGYLRQCGFLFRHGLLQHRDPHQAVYRHFLHCPL